MNGTPVDASAGAGHPGSVDFSTVESLVRHRLSVALGGRRGMAEGAVPTLGFTVTFLAARDLRLGLSVGIGLAVALLVVRVLQRQPVQFVVNSLLGIGIAAVFAARTGKAEDVFLPGILYNAAYAVVLAVSVLVRWPLVGLMIASVTGDITGWRADRALVRLCARLTWLLALPCVVRVAVQLPLYLAGQVGWLGVAKVVLGWPLQVAALAAMAWLLGRNSTPVDRPGDGVGPVAPATGPVAPATGPVAPAAVPGPTAENRHRPR